MDFLKELFEKGAITWEQFSSAVTEKGYKLADLSTGNYVGKQKYDNELSSKDVMINDLKGQIATRDKDLGDLKTQLENGNTDNKTKVAELSDKLSKLQGDYDTATKDYEAKLSKQAYEFAVKEVASSQKFSSKAAQKQFINDMISAELKMKDNVILGSDDYVKTYKAENADSFVTEALKNPEPAPDTVKPIFVQPTPAKSTPGNDNPFISAFNFV